MKFALKILVLLIFNILLKNFVILWTVLLIRKELKNVSVSLFSVWTAKYLPRFRCSPGDIAPARYSPPSARLIPPRSKLPRNVCRSHPPSHAHCFKEAAKSQLLKHKQQQQQRWELEQCRIVGRVLELHAYERVWKSELLEELKGLRTRNTRTAQGFVE